MRLDSSIAERPSPTVRGLNGQPVIERQCKLCTGWAVELVSRRVPVGEQTLEYDTRLQGCRSRIGLRDDAECRLDRTIGAMVCPVCAMRLDGRKLQRKADAEDKATIRAFGRSLQGILRRQATT